MFKKSVLTALILLILMAGTVFAEPDSLWVGQLYAYQVNDSIFKVPLFYSNDNPLRSLGFPVMFVSSGGPIIPDSVTLAGRTYGTNMFDLFLDFTSGTYGGNPDSTCIGLISFTSEIPAGDGVIAELWFTGGQVGDMMSFLPIPNYPPACAIGSSPTDPDGGPVHAPTAVVILEGGTEIVCQSSITGMATHVVSFPVYVNGSDGPFTLEIISFDGPNPWEHEPSLNGDNPWNFTWLPGFNDVGQFEAVLRATNSNNETTDKVITINIEALEVDPCDVARGDLNCDGVVDIADLVFMVDWMFSGGPAPYCK
ncbi:MAG: hypothetical protein KAW46_06055 [candidate division Zixibacteria bacterium]|nr:hypothetical protein [candidate division Zixibacteria bacterium]